MRIDLATESHPDPDVISWIEENLRKETIQSCGAGEDEELAVVAVHDGVLVGGIYGSTWGGTCDLQGFWVEPAFRHCGIGLRLLTAAENEAARRGCRQVELLTHEMSGSRLYRDNGYQLAGQVEDYPRGHRTIWFVKQL